MDTKESRVTAQPRLSLDDVRAIAELAKLHLTDEELHTYTAQLSQILDYFTLLQEVDTSHVQAATVLPLRSVMRPDVPQPPLDPAEAVRNASDSEDNQFKVNVVLGDE
jgi:aspartyl-tRNA(Asn)/glutamyl-tRNA(Gln) amidotransferase subunit C